MHHLIACFLFVSMSTIFGQAMYTRNTISVETSLIAKIDKKFSGQLDVFYRRSSDASHIASGSSNVFKNAAQHVYRAWIHYQMNENIRFSLSPFGFWETYTSALEADGVKKIQPEFRVCPQVTLTNKTSRITMDHRFRYEYRLFGAKVDDRSTGEFGYDQGMDFSSDHIRNRFRYYFRVQIPLGHHQKVEEKTFYINAWNELFLGFGSGTNNDKIWDQNRTYCTLGYKPKMKVPMRFEVGCGMFFVNRSSSSINSSGLLVESSQKVEWNRVLQMSVVFEQLNMIFDKKK